jgi:hypothetical protein
MIGKVDAAIAKDHNLLIKVDDAKVRELGPQLDDLLTKKERVVKINLELQKGANELSTVVNDILKGATDKVQGSLNEITSIFGRFKEEFLTWQPEVRANVYAHLFINSMNGLVAKFEEFRAKVPEFSTVGVQGDTSQAIAAITNLEARISGIPKVTTVYVNYVERHTSDASGSTPGMAGGGFLPGWGGGDRIHALLEAGEFVLNKQAVRLYGLDRIHAMNQMQLPRFKVPEIPRFAFGGLVHRLLIPSVPPVAFAGGGSVTPQVEGVVQLDLSFGGRPVASIPGPRQQIRQMVDALKELERGMR